MAIAEKLNKKLEGLKGKITKKSEKAKKGKETAIDSNEWLLLFLAAGYVQLILIAINVIGLIPFVGQAAYPVLVAAVNIPVTGAFFLYLTLKGRAYYWGLAFGGGVANLIPVINWLGWVGCVVIFYFLVKAEKVPLAGEAIEKAAKAASKIK